MARTDDDSWDLASSVGATATMVAAARAVASRSPDPLINDPFAEPLVRAVGVDRFSQWASGELNLLDDDGKPNPDLKRMVDWVAVRTWHFDQFFTDAADAGIRQVVILASGLDSRAYRMRWPTGTTVFEIDQPRVIEFKTNTLAELGATGTARRIPVGIDLRQDWPTALRHAGFNDAQPAAWLAEGLLPYLPPQAQDRLLDDVTALSVAGTRFAGNGPGSSDQPAPMVDIANRWLDYDFDADMSDVAYQGERNDPAAYLNERGWQALSSSTAELFAASGVTPAPDKNDPLSHVVFVRAIKQ